MEILLGSGSPRRHQLLHDMDIAFTPVHIKNIEEVYPDSLPAHEVSAYLSRLKALGYKDELSENQLLITADTIVLLDGEILGKPIDRDDAIEMLCQLSGKTHVVITGVTLTTTSNMETFTETTEVEFARLTRSQIADYVDKHRPLDKAGAYGIQEWIGLTGVKAIRGCFYNVMGLPTAKLYERLKPYLAN